MVAEGEPLVSAIGNDSLLRGSFSKVVAELLGAYKWRQPYMSAYCPADGDQRQFMADRVVNIASQTLCNDHNLRDENVSDGLMSAAIEELVLPFLQRIPADVPATWAEGTAEEQTRAAKVMRKARANKFDHFIVRPITKELRQMAEQRGQRLPASRSISEINLEDSMADGIGRLLGGVRQRIVGGRYRDAPLMAPWVPRVLAAGAATKLAMLLPEPTQASLTDQTTAMAAEAYRFWARLEAMAGPQVPAAASASAAAASASAAAASASAAAASASAPAASETALPTEQQAAPAIAPRVGARVTVVGLSARPELNGRAGVLDGRKNAERWLVQLITPDGMRDGPAIALKPANLCVATPPPPAAEARGRCLEVGPAPLAAARDAIPVRVAPEPLPVTGANLESREKAILQSSRGWRCPLGLKAYTKEGTYPDLYCYFDAEDATSEVNHWAMRAFTAYPMDIGGLPAHGIRGSVIVIRANPPTSTSFFGGSGGDVQNLGVTGGGAFDPTIRVEEMRDTLLFYGSRDASAIARERDMQRTGAMMGGMMGGMQDLGVFTMP